MIWDTGSLAGVSRRRNAGPHPAGRIPAWSTASMGGREQSGASRKRSACRRIGLFGGSFDPPHEGHLHVTREALRRLRLHAVWWIVSPGNPLKGAPAAPFECRISAARRLIGRDRRISVSDVEVRLDTRHTVDTVSRLLTRAPMCRYVWIMGADNLASFHRWKAWAELVEQLPIAVLPRPGAQLRAGLSPAARRFARCRAPQRCASGLALCRPPRWCLLGGPLADASSTIIRTRRT